MTNDEQLSIGPSLSEILFFELEQIQEIHKESKSSRGLWNEKNNVPVFEQNMEGRPDFLSDLKLLGVSGKVGSLLRLAQFVIFSQQPAVLTGSIHKFGKQIRLQVILEGRRDSKGHVRRSKCWIAEDDLEELSNIPKMVSKLGRKIYMELADNNGCKTPESFYFLTKALKKHSEYDTLKDQIVADEAIILYEEAIDSDKGKNAMASYNIALIRYSRYQYRENELAIKYFLCALHTPNSVLRAQAYSGLANAFCQKFQRHKSGDDLTLLDAIRYAEYGYEIEGQNVAAIVKALAYAWQVVNEADISQLNKGDKTPFENAEKFYREAIKLHKKYTIAHNNLGYMYLYMAKKEQDNDEKCRFLSDAERSFQDAIKCDPTYFDAYDNLGQVYELKKDYENSKLQYYNALDYNPNYYETSKHLSLLYLCLVKESIEIKEGPKVSFLKKALEFHKSALVKIKGEAKKMESTCSVFSEAFKSLNLELADIEYQEELNKVLKGPLCRCTEVMKCLIKEPYL